ncbi:hypothetical protein FXO37_02809 [Capsicum annuum]|nr:hypothetical protein FXO37_02809 [Capsicum annuum]
MIERTFLEEAGPRMILEPLGGKMNEISESETPFSHRKGNLYNIQYTVGWSDNSESISTQKMAWLRKLYKEMEPYVAKSPRTAYLNYRDLDFGTNQEDYSYSKAKMWGEKYFNGNFERLRSLLVLLSSPAIQVRSLTVFWVSNCQFCAIHISFSMVEVVDQDTSAPRTIDVGNPLYIHPFDSVGASLVPIPFDGVGYRSWRRGVLQSLS